VVAKLRRGADALEKDESFRIQIAGVRIRVGVGRPGQADHDAGETNKLSTGQPDFFDLSSPPAKVGQTMFDRAYPRIWGI
jgi:hypothetical protein